MPALSIICLVPTDSVPDDVEVRPDHFEGGILCKQGFVDQVIGEAARVLVKGGELVMWMKVSHKSVIPYYALTMKLAQQFDLASMNILVHDRDQDLAAVYDDPGVELDSSCMLFSIKKRS